MLYIAAFNELCYTDPLCIDYPIPPTTGKIDIISVDHWNMWSYEALNCEIPRIKGLLSFDENPSVFTYSPLNEILFGVSNNCIWRLNLNKNYKELEWYYHHHLALRWKHSSLCMVDNHRFICIINDKCVNYLH